MPKINSYSRKKISEYHGRQTHNLFTIYIPTIDQFSVPLKTKIRNQPELEELQKQFAQYIAEVIRSKVVKAIKSNQYARDYAPYSTKYLKRKIDNNWSMNYWEATGDLVNSITYWRTGDIFVVGIPENIQHPVYGSDKTFPTYRIAKVLEMGDPTRNIPPRPLFLPVFRNVSKHMGRYLESFLNKYDPRKTKRKRKRHANPMQMSQEQEGDL